MSETESKTLAPVPFDGSFAAVLRAAHEVFGDRVTRVSQITLYGDSRIETVVGLAPPMCPLTAKDDASSGVMITQFLSDAKSYCERAGIKPATLGHYAVGDNTLFRRLEGGGQCLPRTMDWVRQYMADHPVSEADAMNATETPTPKEDAA